MYTHEVGKEGHKDEEPELGIRTRGVGRAGKRVKREQIYIYICNVCILSPLYIAQYNTVYICKYTVFIYCI